MKLRIRRPRPLVARRQIPDKKLWIHRQGRDRVENYVRTFEAINGLSSPPITWGA